MNSLTLPLHFAAESSSKAEHEDAMARPLQFSTYLQQKRYVLNYLTDTDALLSLKKRRTPILYTLE